MSDMQLTQDPSDQAMAMYFASDTARRIEKQKLKQGVSKAQRPLKWVAISQSILPIIMYPLVSSGLESGYHFLLLMELALCLIAAAFWLIWMWSLSNPLPAAIVGLLLLTSLIFAASAAQDPHSHRGSPPSVGIVTLVNMVLLARAISVGSLERRLERAGKPSVDGTPGVMPRGIASAIWLYLALLSIVVLPTTLTANHEFAFDDIFKICRFMGIVVFTWAAIAWRDTLPAYLKSPEAKWYAWAIIIAVFSSLFASIYCAALNIILGLQVTDMARPYFDHGYSWLMVIAMVAVFPAVFEEMAFRGVIVPCLLRALTEKETILASGIMFMTLHLSVFSAPHLLFLGCALAYVRLRSGSIWPCMVMHFTHNALTLFLK